MELWKTVAAKQKEYFWTNETRPVEFRINQLKKLKQALVEWEDRILEALNRDLGKPKAEAYSTEIGMVHAQINEALLGIRKWTMRKNVSASIINFYSEGELIWEPYGTVLIFAPWNYPLQLTISPLVGAMAAGNCAVIKPSEEAPYTAKVIKGLVEENFLPDYIQVICGDSSVAKGLAEQPFDYIFFTGSQRVGKEVMHAAAENLTPVTLELGGKSPCIVTEDAHIKLAAKRIMWGKLINAGQTCVAPDYVYVHRSVKERFLSAATSWVNEYYGSNPLDNPEYCKIINAAHYERIMGFIEGKIVCGGHGNGEKIEPTIIDDADWTMPCMQEEIFGPVLPVLSYDDLKEVQERIRQGPTPLALYLFAEKEQTKKEIMALPFGGGCINDTVMHLTTPNLPFGGKGASGMGNYHGYWSFQTFSHQKGILKKSVMMDVGLRYPPYGTKRMRKIKKFLK